MADHFCPSHKAIFEELERLAPGAPFLALGQTAFWDEPMKAGVLLCSKAQGFERRFVAGVHDTDYFAKHSAAKAVGGYVALPHNDTTTKDLWSAAGEFSALFGSETVVTREMLQKSGAKLGKIQRERPGTLSDITEAWGWRGVALQGDSSAVIAETPIGPLQHVLLQTLDWAIDETLARVPKCHREVVEDRARQLRSIACESAGDDPSRSLSDYYRDILPRLYSFAAGESVPIEATATSKLLRFNPKTAHLPRFQLVDAFLQPKSRELAVTSYNETLRGSEIYTLDRFGSWAIPFDLVIPGRGRGTIRVAPKAVIIMTPEPSFITTKTPVQSVQDLARAIERKFGPNCTLVGKAVSLIGMLASEFVFVFHEGASGYVHHSRAFHRRLGEAAPNLHPILRVKYQTWDAFEECQTWLSLPEPFQQPFGAEELSTKSFAARWRVVQEEQRQLLADLATLRRPIDFVQFLAKRYGSSWSEPAHEYEAMHDRLQVLHSDIEVVREKRRQVLEELRKCRAERDRLEHEKGVHWRSKIFEREPTNADMQHRTQLNIQIASVAENISVLRKQWVALINEQNALVQAEEVQRAHEQRRVLELELELKRLKLVRQAVTVSKGLSRAGFRPSSWWFPLLCPDGGWFRATVNTAEYYLEPLK